MNSIVEAKVDDFLKSQFRLRPYQRQAVIAQINELGRMAGYDLDERFAGAGMGAGPEARVASRIVARALGEEGSETPDYEILQEIRGWIRRAPGVLA
ncbi:MAG TPA: hypothetical protein VGM03_14655 [Phycisphaerae bacterium]|jgi:hypothetical protein